MSQVQTQILIKFIFRISTKHQLLSQTSASPIKLKFKILTKPNFRISTKIQIHNLYKTSAKKKLAKPQLQNLRELQLQNLDHTLCSESEQKLSFMTKPQQLENICDFGSVTPERGTIWNSVSYQNIILLVSMRALDM